MIHTIGDSHSSTVHSGWKHCKNIIPHHIGPVLCYSFGKEPLSRFDISKVDNINDGDTLVFCFGEVDCRNHVNKQVIKQNVSYKVIIDELILDYVSGIKTVVDALGKKLKNICIYNCIPTIKEETRKKLNWNGHPFPCEGSSEDRKIYTLYFNEKAKQICKDNQFIFFDIFDKIIDNNGYLKSELSDGNSHLLDGKALNEFIDTFLL